MFSELIKQLEAAEEGSRELSDKVLLACGWRRVDPGSRIDFPFWLTPEPESHDTDENSRPCPTTNLQDALDYAVPEGWSPDGIHWSVAALVGRTSKVLSQVVQVGDDGWPNGKTIGAYGATPALSFCAAALRAREA